MSEQEEKQKIEQLREIQKEIERQDSDISHENFNESTYDSYQPTTNELDDDNPPDDE